MKTVIQIEVEHTKALPSEVTDKLAERAYTYLHNIGARCDVTARFLEVRPEPVKAWEAK